MTNLTKTIIALLMLGFLSACAYDPAVGRYSSSSNYYGQGYRQNSTYANPNYGYQQPAYGYGNSGYQQSPYGYSGYQQRPYCPDDDDDD
jgi:hypothetical protein